MTDLQLRLLTSGNITAEDVDEAFAESSQHSIGSGMSQEGSANMPLVKSKAEFDALSSGDRYAIDLNGKIITLSK